jgi:hypothetical protein
MLTNFRELMYQGWMQTAVVHLSSPRQLFRDLGPRKAFVALLLFAAMIASSLVHPLFLAASVWAALSGQLFPEIPSLPLSLLLGLNLTVFSCGYAAAFAAGFKGVKTRRLSGFAHALGGMPVYWLLISFSAYVALWQFFRSPFHWNKTEHGFTPYRKPGRSTAARGLERAMGIEPTTSSLGSLRSTTELRPRPGSIVAQRSGRFPAPAFQTRTIDAARRH